MTNTQLESHPVLTWHLLFLSRIYVFIGWLGMLGSIFLLLAGFAAQPDAPLPAVMPGLPWFIPPLLLAAWSTVLLNFSKDIINDRHWTMGLPGCLVAVFSLISVPIGTAVGLYTLYVLFQYKRTITQLIHCGKKITE